MSLQEQAAAQNEVARRQSGDIAEFVQQMGPAIAQSVPASIDPQQLARVVLTEVRKNPKLAACNRESFAAAMLTAATLGLRPGIEGECYLVPYKAECTFILGYRGMVKLFLQHPAAYSLESAIVYQGDRFQYVRGTSPVLIHEPVFTDRGRPVAFYAIAKLKSGATFTEVLTVEEVAALRAISRNPGGKPDPQHWMERKTVLRQLMRLLPKSEMLTDALNADEQTGNQLAATSPLPTIETRQ